MAAVVLYHAQVPGVQGGFVGVDVFFVISGFLICGMIYDEIRVTHHFSFSDFYARRARRILPAAAVTLAAVGLTSWLMLPPLQTLTIMTDVLAAVFYVANWRFIAQETDYMHQGAGASPVQHFWSLSVEEQFYFVWPLLFLFAGLVARRLFHRHQTTPFYGVTLVTLGASFALSLFLTETNPPEAYLSTLTRAWQFALGALGALLIRSINTGVWPRTLRFALGFTGLAAVLVACIRYTDATPYPGLAAVMPSVGVTLVMVVGHTSNIPAQTRFVRAVNPSFWLSHRAVRWIGSISYSWYLWHWPAIVFLHALKPDAGWPELLVAALLSMLPAYLSLKLIENPIRLSGTVKRHPRQGISIGVAASMIAVMTFIGVNGTVKRSLSTLSALAVGTGVGLSVADPLDSALASGPVTPSVMDAFDDYLPYPDSPCLVTVRDVALPPCVIAPDGSSSSSTASETRMVLFGDSHAEQWYPLVAEISASDHLEVEVLAKMGCPAPTMTVYSPVLDRDYHECDTWREAALTHLENSPAPRAIFISSLNHYVPSGPELSAAWSVTLDRLKRLGSPIYYIADTPFPKSDVPECISAHLDDWTQCAFPLDEALATDHLATRVALGDETEVAVLNFNAILCPSDGTRTCPAVRAGVLLYRDASHLTRAAVTAVTPFGLALFESAPSPRLPDAGQQG